MPRNLWKSLLECAVLRGDSEQVKCFLDSGKYDVNLKLASGSTLLIEAVKRGFFDVVQLLLQKGADVNRMSSRTETPLGYACEAGCIAMIKLLAKFGVNTKGQAGAMALRGSIRAGHCDIIEYLVEKLQVDVNAPDEYGRTAASHACEVGFFYVVCLLYTFRTDFNLTFNYNLTPLMYACKNNHEDVVMLLLTNGVDVNRKAGLNEDTALAIACRAGHQEVVQHLLNNNADIHHMVECKSILRMALEHDHITIFYMLLQELTIRQNNGVLS